MKEAAAMYFELKRAILESGLKQIFIARKLGLDPALLSKKLNGYRPITQTEKKQLAEILKRR